MKKLLILISILSIPLFGLSQTWKGTGIGYTSSAPTFTPPLMGGWVVVDTLSGQWYEWDKNNSVWREMGFRIQLTYTNGVPNYTPTKQRSRFALNVGDSLYVYQSGVWTLLNPKSVSYSDTTSLIATKSYVGSQGYLTTEVDGSTTNELQTLSITSDGSQISISSGNSISIPYDTLSIATFGGGSGIARDTAVFSTSTIYGSFYHDGTDTLIITKMVIGLQGTSPSVVVDVIYNDTLNVTGTKLVTAGSTATNTAGGTSVTAFDQTKIPPGNWVWAKTPTVTTKPTYMSITIIGYRKRKA